MLTHEQKMDVVEGVANFLVGHDVLAAKFSESSGVLTILTNEKTGEDVITGVRTLTLVIQACAQVYTEGGQGCGHPRRD